LDGAEIRESVLSLLALNTQGAQVSIFAPNIDQHHVVNHLDQSEKKESRNVLEEAARVARGKISDLTQLQAADFDGLVIPGGFGVATNLCNFAIKGPECEVNALVEKTLHGLHRLNKPIGAICIAR